MGADLAALIKMMTTQSASDMHLKAGRPPLFRISGILREWEGAPALSMDDLVALARTMLSEDQLHQLFKSREEVDLAYAVPMEGASVMRVRVNVFWQRGTLEMVMRRILDQIPSFEALRLPPVLQRIAMTPRGLILVTGTVGSGKSTTIASIIRYINENRPCHIVSIEDPIEFVHEDMKSSISQRELGIDTPSYAHALRSALRQDPDVLFIGEMRDMDTVTTAMKAAETGHLVLSTLHTIDAVQTIDRIIDFFPPSQQHQVRNQFAGSVEAVISQRLISRKDGQGRVPAVEVMIGTPTIRGLIREGKLREIRAQVAAGGAAYGMQTFDQSLISLVQQGLITLESALAEATSPNDVKLAASGIISSSASAKTILQS